MVRESIPIELINGWIYKWTNPLLRYRKRFFSISNDSRSLIYNYSSNPKQAQAFDGIIYLENAEIKRNGKCGLTISDGDSIFYLKTEKPVDQHKWYVALKKLTKENVNVRNNRQNQTNTSDNDDIKSAINSLQNSIVELNDTMKLWNNELRQELKNTNDRVAIVEQKLSIVENSIS